MGSGWARIAVGVALLGTTLAGEGAPGQLRADYRLAWPAIALSSQEGERIHAVELTLTCGRFTAITRIPNDWSVQVDSPVSDVTTLHAAAGHGSSALFDLRPLDGAIRIRVHDRSCFDLSAVVTSISPRSERTRTHELARSQLKLRP